MCIRDRSKREDSSVIRREIEDEKKTFGSLYNNPSFLDNFFSNSFYVICIGNHIKDHRRCYCVKSTTEGREIILWRSCKKKWIRIRIVEIIPKRHCISFFSPAFENSCRWLFFCLLRTLFPSLDKAFFLRKRLSFSVWTAWREAGVAQRTARKRRKIKM